MSPFTAQQPVPTPSVPKVSRTAAIGRLRKELLKLTDDDHSMCAVAAEKGVFCRGFRQYTDQELRSRYDWIVQRNPTATRDELEQLANLWQLARQVFDGVPIACDAQQREHDTCNGWDDFTNEELARHWKEILGQDVTIV